MSGASENESLGRALRQSLETGLLMGVDFAPKRVEVPAVEEAESAAGGGGSEKGAALEALRAEHERECPERAFISSFTNIVFGEGDPDARLMFVGEAPGAEEDRTGRPFVGRAGELLEGMLRAMGLSRGEVYIANVLKVRPPGNATPTPEEIAACGPYLRRQVEIIEPEVIVTLGKPATGFLLDSGEALGRLRGRWHSFEGIPVMPTYHPAYLLRAYTPENRKKVWSDLQMVMERLGLEGPRG